MPAESPLPVQRYRRKRPSDSCEGAVQLTEHADWTAIAEWCGGEVIALPAAGSPGGYYVHIAIPDDGGTSRAYADEWILKFPWGFQPWGELTFAEDWEPLETTGSASEGDDQPPGSQDRSGAYRAALNDIAEEIRGQSDEAANLIVVLGRCVAILLGRAAGDPR